MVNYHQNALFLSLSTTLLVDLTTRKSRFLIMAHFESTPELEKAKAALHTGGPFTLIHGRAGTGKSTLLRQFLLETPLFIPVLAPTGIAALNVGGQTIHRFFGFPPTVTVERAKAEAKFRKQKGLFKKLELIVIDEISMVRADLMDCMDIFLRTVRKDARPFGGIRIVAFGDLFQLPPVVTSREYEAFAGIYPTPYFFSSSVIGGLTDHGLIEIYELEKVFRQKDQDFIKVLNALRSQTHSAKELMMLNQRVGAALDQGAIMLTTRNIDADVINQKKLQALKHEEVIYDATVTGDFKPSEMPTDQELTLKKGARVMCIANDPLGRYVNGSLGWVEGFEEDERDKDLVLVKLDDGQVVAVGEHQWSLSESHIDAETHEMVHTSVGSFTQLPLKLAWAVTIHKSQGKTFDQVMIDFGLGAFAHGQAYVALSRCRSLEGISLTRPIRMSDIKTEKSVIEFLNYMKNT